MLSAKISREFKNNGISNPPIRRLGRLEVHIALSNRNIDVQILAQGYCFATVSLSLYFKLADDIRKALIINQGTERIE